MVKREITEFKLNMGEHTGLSCRVPFSVASVLSGAGAEGKCKVTPDNAARFSAVFTLVRGDLDSKYAYLRITDVIGKATVSLNGTLLGEANGEREVCTYDCISAAVEGENTLEISFSGGEVCGVFGRVELLKFNYAIIDNITITEAVEDNSVTLGIRMDTLGSMENVRAVATLVSGAGQIYYGGLTRGRGNIVVRDPLLWWPRGLGIQNLYKLTVNLYGDVEVEDTVDVRIGLCRITTAKSADGALMTVNGVDFLPMGAVYRPEAESDPLLLLKKTEAVVTSAAGANFNTLIIPLGTPRLPDAFYSLCDAYGIVAIHEISDIDTATSDLLSRKNHHPSLGLVDIVGAGDHLDELTERIRRISPDIDFSHTEEKTVYPGVPSLPTDKAVAALIPETERNIFSADVEKRLSVPGAELIARASERHLYAKDLSQLSYITRLVAAEEIKEKMMRARLGRGNVGRAVFSSIGVSGDLSSDCSLDSSAVWKAGQYYAAGFFAPVVAFADIQQGCVVGFYVSNERRTAFSGELELRILDNKNNVIFRATEACEANEGSAKKLFTKDFTKHVAGKESECYLEYILREGNSILSRDTLLFVAPKRFKFLDPKIRAEIVGADKRFSVTLTAEAFAKDVEIDFGDADVLLSDNDFCLTGTAPVKISFAVRGRGEAVDFLRENLRIRSVYDIGK